MGIFLKPLPPLPYSLTAKFAREQGSMPTWQVEMFHELLYLAKKAHEIEKIVLMLKDENVKLKAEIKFMYDVLDEELNKEKR